MLCVYKTKNPKTSFCGNAFLQQKISESRSFRRFSCVFLTLGELRSSARRLEAVLLKVSGSKILYLSRFLRVMPLGCPLGCPREAPVLVWCLFPLGLYNIAQDDCFFKRQEEERMCQVRVGKKFIRLKTLFQSCLFCPCQLKRISASDW